MRTSIMAKIFFLGLVLCSCSTSSIKEGDLSKKNKSSTTINYKGEINLYGESHGVKKILDKELEIWNKYYQKGKRHLFVELPYYTTEYLNTWMREANDSILDEIYTDWKGTALYNPDTYTFYKMIKAKCPETVFHGTDVGHQYNTTGKRFLHELEEKNLTTTKEYDLTQEAIEQGKTYYNGKNDVYRENTMVVNFIRELEQVNNENVVGIYGSAHIGLNNLDNSGKVPCMANQLKKKYVNCIQSTDLRFLAKEIKPIRVDTIVVNNKEYIAYYFGKQDLNGFKKILYREFWMLDGAYDDLKSKKKTGDYLPYDNYPMIVDIKQVFVIDYTNNDQTKKRMYYRTDGETRDEKLISNNIDIE